MRTIEERIIRAVRANFALDPHGGFTEYSEKTYPPIDLNYGQGNKRPLEGDPKLEVREWPLTMAVGLMKEHGVDMSKIITHLSLDIKTYSYSLRRYYELSMLPNPYDDTLDEDVSFEELTGRDKEKSDDTQRFKVKYKLCKTHLYAYGNYSYSVSGYEKDKALFEDVYVSWQPLPLQGKHKP